MIRTVLTRYLARDIVLSSLVVMLALVALFLFFDFNLYRLNGISVALQLKY